MRLELLVFRRDFEPWLATRRATIASAREALRFKPHAQWVLHEYGAARQRELNKTAKVKVLHFTAFTQVCATRTVS